MTTMKAAVMHGPGDIRFEDVAAPSCPSGGFVVKVEAVGLCGSDIRNLSTDSRKGKYPHIYGHEVVGTVVESDADSERVTTGQRIYLYPLAHCLACEFCRAGHHEQCTDVEEYTESPGGFAQYISYSARRVDRGAFFPVPDGVSPERASLAEPLSSCYACLDNIDVRIGDSVAILGAGPIGIFLAILARMRGASQVFLIDVNQERLDKASRFGIGFRVDSSRTDAVDFVKQHTGGLGAHKVISANPTTAGQQQALLMARRCGTVVFFGGVPKGTLTEIDSNHIHYSSLWIYGHYGANSMQVQKAFEIAIDPAFPADDVITHVLPLSEIQQAIDLTRSGEALKVVLQPN
ncbi:L-iditol 2-dehydrogenase [Luteococcus japonicus]|uniref:L-iditol 2-dehydrogenase n=1 Tax=Luteococcus japonicus TaxID=33984 RepID=A0A3N1ZWG2_9ACTN|nr:alcohol dehydrogenase catalytic domain-containing protein [Luteococcus japonicus]ROR54502.1 L-iditol 2-dehydrogenase [Luteococcus japonicus]